jgi:MFS family permease
VTTILAAQLAFGLGWSAYLVQPKYLAGALGATPEHLSRIAMMSPIASIAMIPVTVSLMDRVSRVLLFRAGLVLLLAASLGYTTVHHLTPLLYVLQGMVGASYALAYNSSAAAVADEAPRERLGEAIGLLGASNVVTNAIATTLAENIARSFGWQAAFQTSAGLAIVALGMSTRLEGRTAPQHHTKPARIGPSLKGPFGVVLVGSALMGAAFSAMFTFHQPYVLRLGGKSVSPFFIGFTIAAVSIRLFFGSLGDRFGHRQVSCFAMVAYGAVALATAWLRVDYLWAYGLAFGAAHGVVYPTLSTDGVHAVPEGARGRSIALYGGAFNVGVAIATYTWGKIAGAFGFHAVFIAAAGVAFLGALVLSDSRGIRFGRQPSEGSGLSSKPRAVE